jgi:hypothetical protein
MTVFLRHPNAIPTFYDLIASAHADLVIFTDTIKYNRKSASHRIAIGNEWLKLPIPEKTQQLLLHEFFIEEHSKFHYELLQKLGYHYSQCTYYDHFKEEVLACFSDHLNQKNTLLIATEAIYKQLLKLLEWPLPKDEMSLSSIGINEDVSAKDLQKVLAAKGIQCDQVIHSYRSKNYQRQSSFSVEINELLLSELEAKSGINRSDNLLSVLFKWGGYHFTWSKPLF